MGIVSARMSFRLNEFKTWFFSQAELCPQQRVKKPYTITEKARYHTRNMKRIRDYIMAKKEKSTEKFVWKGYCNINVPTSAENVIDAFIKDDKTVFFEFNLLLTSDYTIKYQYDAKNESIKCTATCYNPDSINYGYALSAYAGDWYTALAVLLFKHLTIAEKDWLDYQQATKKTYG
jgi:hypothetical protein